MPCDDVVHEYLDADTSIFTDGWKKQTLPISYVEEREHSRIWFCKELIQIHGREYSLVRWKYIP